MSGQRVAVSFTGSGVRVWFPAEASSCGACRVDPAPFMLTHDQAEDLAVLLAQLVGQDGTGRAGLL